jgi:AcrR family transcriptional regulator
MPRPSQRIDQALLASGRALFPVLGCAGLSVRALAGHAGVNPAMFHYHFGSKDDFLRTLLQQMYDEMFSSLAGAAAGGGAAAPRLGKALAAIARFARGQRAIVSRLLVDALAGEAVALDFVRRNAPRHVALIEALLEQAEAEGALAAAPALQRLGFVLGAVMAPIVFIAGLADRGALAAVPAATVSEHLLSDAAIEARIGWVMRALGAGASTPAPVSAPAPAARSAAPSAAPSAAKRARRRVAPPGPG